jgi:nicotinamidase/pyrazinamidase
MRTVFLDIDTQLDFVNPSGALYVPSAEGIIPTVARLNRHAREADHMLISTTDAHAETDAEFNDWPPHCIAGTLGQRKPAATVTGPTVMVPTAPCETKIAKQTQLIIEKQELDCFSNPNLRPLLESLRPERVVVYGVVTEFCVRCAAMGSLELSPRVELVTDAVQSLDAAARQKFVDEFTAAGGLLTSSVDIFV